MHSSHHTAAWLTCLHCDSTVRAALCLLLVSSALSQTLVAGHIPTEIGRITSLNNLCVPLHSDGVPRTMRMELA